LACGNGSVRTPHPEELFGPDWLEWAKENAIDVGGPDPSLLTNTDSQTVASFVTDAGDTEEKQCTPFLIGRPCRGNRAT